MKKNQNDLEKICVIGLGYVGLPLLLRLSQTYKVIGYDKDVARVSELSLGKDITGEVNDSDLNQQIKNEMVKFTSDISDGEEFDIYIVTVPTPIDQFKVPNLTALKEASKAVGSVLKTGNFVIYESTVFPGATEEVCVEILEEHSGLTWLKDFNVGYSPERINPGDDVHQLSNIVKVVSADSVNSLKRITNLYQNVTDAGVFCAKSIAVAEMAKVIENTQRDLNIALVNEIAIICNRLGIETKEVLRAAETKWNFIPFKPGLVGGHCIGVDPYYLAYKANKVGYTPELILAGRRLNEAMSEHVAKEICKNFIARELKLKGARIAILGITFKEDCTDIRNSKAIDLQGELKSYNFGVDLFDPHFRSFREHLDHECRDLDEFLAGANYECIVVFSPHEEILDLGKDLLLRKLSNNGFIFDVKSIFETCDRTVSL